MEQKVLLPPDLCSYFINYINEGKGNGYTFKPGISSSLTAVVGPAVEYLTGLNV